MSSKIHAAFSYHVRNLVRSYGDNRPRAVVALDKARADVAAGKSRYVSRGKPAGVVTWQDPQPIGNLPFPQYAKRDLAYVEDPDAIGLRFVGRVQADTPRGDIWDDRESGGWYTDPYGDSFKDGTGLCWGEVYQVTARNGESRFVAGYRMGDCEGGPAIDFGTIHVEPRGDYNTPARDLDAARDAARAADSMAQLAAEEEREFQTAWRAGSIWSDMQHDVALTRKELLGLLGERRAAIQNSGIGDVKYFALCDAIRARVSSMVADISSYRRDMAKLKEGDFDRLIFWPGDQRLREAFNDGADESVI